MCILAQVLHCSIFPSSQWCNLTVWTPREDESPGGNDALVFVISLKQAPTIACISLVARTTSLWTRAIVLLTTVRTRLVFTYHLPYRLVICTYTYKWQRKKPQENIITLQMTDKLPEARLRKMCSAFGTCVGKRIKYISINYSLKQEHAEIWERQKQQ